MNFEYELNFFCDVLKKCHIRTSMLSLQDSTDAMLDSWISSIIGTYSPSSMTIQKFFGSIEDTTKYRFTNELKLQYTFMRLPILSEKNILFIGPYLHEPLSSNEILEMGEELKLSPSVQKILKEYYATMPIVAESDRLVSVIDTFCEHIWKTHSFAIMDINGAHSMPVLPFESNERGDNVDDLLVNMEMMEKRYALENELIMAVTLGQQHKEKIFAQAFGDKDRIFESRLQDSVRNAKNYCIIMNTLLRKAAEQGGVHPIHIDKISSGFAIKIEMTTDTKSVAELMREMFSSYCRLVRKHSTQKYSPIVKKAILMIDSDISAEISLSTIAAKQEISAGYLATIFKKETGKTVSEYIREKRINHAVHLLNTTNLQVQTIAMHCGILDVQYFSKIFKKQVGKTPKEYRDAVRR